MATSEKVTAIATSQPATVKEWLQSDAFRAAVKKALPSHLTADRFIRIAMTALMRTPQLAQCSKESIFKAMLDLSSLGLEPDGRRAHLIPYNNKKTGQLEAQLIIDYKGLIELSKRSGDVAIWRAEIVCENDDFGWENGIVSHRIDWRRPRGKMQAVYSHVRTKDGIDDYEVMTKDQVDGIRRRSRAASSGPWVTDFEEMAKKTVMRRHSKRLTLSPELSDALAKDGDRIDVDDSVIVEDLMPKRLSEHVEPETEADTEAEAGPEPAQEHEQEPEPEAAEPAAPPSEPALAKALSPAQVKRLFAIGKNRGYTSDQIKDYVQGTCGCGVDALSRDDYDRVCKDLEAMS